MSESNISDDKLSVLRDALSVDRVCFLDVTTKDGTLRRLCELLSKSPAVPDEAELIDAVLKREALMSTGIGLGLAVPHVRLASVKRLTMAAGISRDGIADYVSLDDKPVYLVFMIAAPEGDRVGYLRLLSAISAQAKGLNGKLLQCGDPGAFVRTVFGEAATEGDEEVRGKGAGA